MSHSSPSHVLSQSWQYSWGVGGESLVSPCVCGSGAILEVFASLALLACSVRGVVLAFLESLVVVVSNDSSLDSIFLVIIAVCWNDDSTPSSKTWCVLSERSFVSSIVELFAKVLVVGCSNRTWCFGLSSTRLALCMSLF